jgi:hypothetical protein
MAEQGIKGAPPEQDVLVCRLRHRSGRQGPSPIGGEVEIENASARAVEIEVDMHPLQYLNLVVLNAEGATVSEWHYGDVFSPLGRTYFLRLAPGEKYTHNVCLLGNVPEEKRQPGNYAVRAVYKHKEFRAVSEPLTVELPDRR